jgi:molybdate transport system substrate-binding protein
MANLKKVIGILLVLIVIILPACNGKAASNGQEDSLKIKKISGKAKKVTLTISLAASLKETMEEIKILYEKNNKSINLIYNFGASGALMQQIEQGAKIDIFISAANKQMDELNSKKLIINSTRKDLLGNKLVLISGKNVDISSIEDLNSTKIKTIAIGEAKSVPAGQYTNEALTKLGIFEELKSKFVYAKDVKSVLTWVESGNADVGFVYNTDARISKKVKFVKEIDKNLHSPIVYPISEIKGCKNSTKANDFIKYLYNDSKVREIFEKYRFIYHDELQ